MEKGEIRWGRVAAAVVLAVLLLPVVIALLITVGPVAVFAIAYTHMLKTAWCPHPGELVGLVIAPIAYTVGEVFVIRSVSQGTADWSFSWLMIGSVVLSAVSLLWAWNDYRAHARSANTTSLST